MVTLLYMKPAPVGMKAALNAFSVKEPLLICKTMSDKRFTLLFQLSKFSPPLTGVTSALHLACALERERCVHQLLEIGASPNLPDYAGRTPLHIAARFGHVDIVGLFVPFFCLLAVLSSGTCVYSDSVGLQR